MQGLHAGVVRISAKLDGLEGSSQLRVTSHELLSLEIGADLSLPRGLMHGLSAVAGYSDGQRTTVTDQVRWQSSDPRIVNVSDGPQSHGVVTALGLGEATVSATLGERAARIKVSVVEPVRETLSIQAPEGPMATNESRTLRALLVLSDGSMRDVSDQVKWSSSAAAVATIDAKGTVQALSQGSVTISAALDDMRAQLNIVVKQSAGAQLP
jgi:uncharacterized protein YjdB